MLLDRVLRFGVSAGSLTVHYPHGLSRRYGDGTGAPVAFAVSSSAAATRIAINPELQLGEAYMDGSLTLRQGSLFDLLLLLMGNFRAAGSPAHHRLLARARVAARRLHQFNPVAVARNNVAHHYDLDGRLYDLFLDADRQYSCAYFASPDATLEEAQTAKMRHIAAKLALQPGQTVLDIGSGWGGLALYLAKYAEVDVTGLTLSTGQHEAATARARTAGLSHRVRFLLRDYREMTGRFDRIVSVGMFEHVGLNHYGEFFRQCAALLKPDGVAVLHAINRPTGPDATSPWIQKYIFPGGSIPALSEVLPPLERAGLTLSDAEILRLHYAETLRHWRRRFLARRAEAVALYDERFARMWEFYLAASEAAFRLGDLNVFQLQFLRRQQALPITRRYMAEAEAALARRDHPVPVPRAAE